MIHLPREIEQFEFAQRETRNGSMVAYKCGRDFLYYALHYFHPERFNRASHGPQGLDRSFGIAVPTGLAWTQLQFYKMPSHLRQHSLALMINNRQIVRFSDFVRAMLFSRIPYAEAIESIERAVDEGDIAGVDLAMRWHGLEDHVLFVYGYDSENLYVFDTFKVPRLEYERLTNDDRYYMKLPKSVIKKRWKMFSRVWKVQRID
jgi:hypothetical protein